MPHMKTTTKQYKLLRKQCIDLKQCIYLTTVPGTVQLRTTVPGAIWTPVKGVEEGLGVRVGVGATERETEREGLRDRLVVGERDADRGALDSETDTDAPCDNDAVEVELGGTFVDDNDADER